jgi:hypothetical protein
MAGLSDFFKVIQEEKKNQDKELHSLLGEEFSTDSFIDSLFSSAKEEIKKEKVIEEKITRIFDDIISNNDETVVEEIVEEEQEDQIIEEEIDEGEIVQESSEDKSINQYIDFLKETVKNNPHKYQESLTNPSSKEIQDLKNLVWQVMRDVRAQGGGGEVNLRYLDDIVGIATNSSAYDQKFLQWNSTTNQAEFVDPNDAGGTTIVNISGITTYYQASNVDDYIGVSANVPVTIVLPQIPSYGKKLIVKDEGNKIATYNITVQAGAGTSVENDTSVLMKINHQSFTYFYNGSNWFLI